MSRDDRQGGNREQGKEESHDKHGHCPMIISRMSASDGALERQPNTQDRKAFTKIELGPSVEVSDAVNVGYRLLFPQLIVVHRSTMIIGAFYALYTLL